MRGCVTFALAACALNGVGMQSASDIRRFLGKLILVLFMVIHAPVSGVMTVAQAGPHSDPAGTGMMVICLDGSFSEIEAPGGPQPSSTGANECLCPCATLGAESAPDYRPSPYVVILQETEIGQVDWGCRCRTFLHPAAANRAGEARARRQFPTSDVSNSTFDGACFRASFPRCMEKIQ